MSRPGRKIPLPPLPVDPSVCRWCGGAKKRFVPDMPARCSKGCRADDAEGLMLAQGHCEDCSGDFLTGDDTERHQCWQCKDAEMGRLRREYAASGRPVTGYLKDRRLMSAVARDQREGRLPS